MRGVRGAARAGVAAALCAALLAVAAPPAGADPSPSGSTRNPAQTSPSPTSPAATTSAAQAQADALATEVDAADLAVERAAEAYDAASSALTLLVTQSIQAREQLAATQRALGQRRAVAGSRARAAARDGGGRLGMVLGVLKGRSPADVLDGYQAIGALVGDDADDVTAARAAVDDAVAASTRLEDLRDRQLQLTAAATHASDEAAAALRARSALLAAADAQVAALADADRERAEQASLAQASSALGADPDAAAPTQAAAAAITAALSRLGDPYVWGATGPDTFDCSGLVQWAYAQAGLALPRTSRQQYAGLPRVALDELAPGDLVFYASDPTDAGTIHHVGLYLGGGRMVHAPHTGDVVRIAAVTRGELYAAVRPSAVPAP